MTFVFDKCCFCIELRTGCLIIGYLNLIGNIIAILMSIIGLAAAGVVTAEGDKEDGTQAVGAVALAVIGILLIFFILFLTFSIVLLVGLHKHKRGHIKAYLIYTVIFLVLYVIMFFAGFAASHINGGVVARDLISILLSIYFLLVIRSYYLKMDDPSNKPAVYNTA
ncbi:hypothetical protein SFRURICE_006600 [Spodoptera frugiperda]|uniref:Uncharacterized protein LOC118267440 n=1 Tax=Spodoptera frugiperda TaxID=7108 RepID=A0A9R0D2B7_SPOFR|nr:uncharacterized protein LOC118267440 [Spodoptera frugiperda]KAF9823387.1 hypothetical protein SFRURICE_006600 [Spodoptera frugiperda]